MSIDDMLGKLLHEFKFKTPEGATPKGYDGFKQALYKDMVELIGEDEPVDPKDKHEVIQMQFYANTTRQKLRNKLKEYFGEQE